MYQIKIYNDILRISLSLLLFHILEYPNILHIKNMAFGIPILSATAELISVTTDKSSYGPGETVNITVDVKNTGNSSLSGLQINVDIAGPTRSNVKAGLFQGSISLSAGQQKRYSSGYWTVPSNPSEGTYTVTAAVKNSGIYHERKTTFTVSVKRSSELVSATTAYSGANRPLIPIHFGHPFRTNSATQSGANRPPLESR